MHASEPLPPGAHDPALASHLQGRDVHCKKCKYNLRDLSTNRCPECGTTYMLAGGTPISEIADPSGPSSSPCPTCGYDRSGLPGSTCPECGYDPAIPKPAEPPPSNAPLPRVVQIHVPIWPRVVRNTLHWIAILGHALGWVAAAFFVLGWLAVPDEIRAARSNSGVARIILLHTARTILPIVAFIVALIWHRHQRPVQRRSVQNLLSSIALGWLWLIVLYLVWRLVPP